ncbi:MAG: hypothetical protein LBV69_05615 [Bacteroidales bacterium]|jgi:hypothetical protein|nr:hypothetical protein [Bacteroidales bacterium]
MKKISLILILFLVTISIFAQEENLTKKQMYQDFDELVKIIEEGNPQLEVRKIVTGFHQIDTIKSLRKNIDTITNYSSFHKLLNLVLFYCFDAHTREEDTFYPIDNLKNIDTIAIIKQKKYYHSSEYRKKMELNGLYNNFSLNPYYFENNYWLLGKHYLIHKNKIDTIHITNMRLISYNGQNFTKYVEKNCKLGFYYDYQQQKYFYGHRWLKIPSKGILKGKQEGKIIEFNIEDYPGAIIGGVFENQNLDVLFKKIPKIENFLSYPCSDAVFFDKDSILYIYIREMVEDTALCNKIKEITRNKKINKVVIDVRGNRGGSDYAWRNVLQAIIKDTLSYRVKLAYNDSKIMHEMFKYRYTTTGYEAIEWLNNKKMCLIEANMSIKPDSNSINYSGKIYILSDKKTYSAGFSFVNFADQFKHIISIGCPTGQIEGWGIGPQLFQLKNSKFTFRMACTIDILNCNKAIDAYKDFPEILVYPTFEEEMIYPRTSYEYKNEMFLRRFDSMFQKVLELE